MVFIRVLPFSTDPVPHVLTEAAAEDGYEQAFTLHPYEQVPRWTWEWVEQGVSIHGQAAVYHYAFAPYWLLLVALLVLPAVRAPIVLPQLYRRWRRRTPGRCHSCGYDLRATPERCPECGSVPTEAAA